MANSALGRVPTTEMVRFLRQFFANRGSFDAACWGHCPRKEKMTKSGGKLTKKRAIGVVGTYPRREGMPFEVAKPAPNAKTLSAMLNNMEIIPKTYNSFHEILEEVDDLALKV